MGNNTPSFGLRATGICTLNRYVSCASRVQPEVLQVLPIRGDFASNVSHCCSCVRLYRREVEYLKLLVTIIFFSFLTNLAFPVGEVRLFYSSLRRKVSFPVIKKGKIEILGNKIYSLSFKFPACLLSYAIFFDHLVDRSFSSSPWNEIAHGFPRSHRSTSLVTWAYRNAATPIVIITFNTWFLTRHGSGRGGHHHHEETRMIDAATLWIVLHLHPLLESFDASWWDLWQASE